MATLSSSDRLSSLPLLLRLAQLGWMTGSLIQLPYWRALLEAVSCAGRGAADAFIRALLELNRFESAPGFWLRVAVGYHVPVRRAQWLDVRPIDQIGHPAPITGAPGSTRVQREEPPMRPYETMIIFDVGVEDTAINAALDKGLALIRTHGGTTGIVDRWGKRAFAYELKKKREGYYVVAEFSADPTAAAELDRYLSLADEVLRHKIVRLPDRVVGRNRRPAPSSPPPLPEPRPQASAAAASAGS